MLLAVEGGGFFSSSASGYSKGLTLLLLGPRAEERQMRVSPWNQYQLVDREPDPDSQLATRKYKTSRGCASFLCFRRPSSGLDGTSPPKVGPVHAPDAARESSGFADAKDSENRKRVCLKSNLKKPSDSPAVPDEPCHDPSGISHEIESRKVQWTDACGGELVEVREFEVSSFCSSEETYDEESNRSCACMIQ